MLTRKQNASDLCVKGQKCLTHTPAGATHTEKNPPPTGTRTRDLRVPEPVLFHCTSCACTHTHLARYILALQTNAHTPHAYAHTRTHRTRTTPTSHIHPHTHASTHTHTHAARTICACAHIHTHSHIHSHRVHTRCSRCTHTLSGAQNTLTTNVRTPHTRVRRVSVHTTHLYARTYTCAYKSTPHVCTHTPSTWIVCERTDSTRTHFRQSTRMQEGGWCTLKHITHTCEWCACEEKVGAHRELNPGPLARTPGAIRLHHVQHNTHT